MKKLTALTLSFLMVLSCIPVDARVSAAGAQLTNRFEKYFSGNLSREAENVITHEGSEEDNESDILPLEQMKQEFDQAVRADIQDLRNEQNQQKQQVKKPEPQEDLETYFLDNEILSALGEITTFDQRQKYLACYVARSNFRTGKGLSEGDHAVVLGFIKLAQAALSYFNIPALDLLEGNILDKVDSKQGLAKESMAVANNILEAAKSENHAVDYLYKQIQHNAFFVLVLNKTDYKKVLIKYPEVGFLFEDLYTFFSWRYEMCKREPDYCSNEDQIHNVMSNAIHINSFLGWWEIANEAKEEMAESVRDTEETGLDPFTPYTAAVESKNMRNIYLPHRNNARYFGRIWNNMQKYAGKERGMQNMTKEEAEAKGLGTVPVPVRGFLPSVRRFVYDSLKNLTDQEVYQSLLSIRKEYVTMRARSEKEWKNKYETVIKAAISGNIQDPCKDTSESTAKPFVTDDDIKSISESLSMFGISTPFSTPDQKEQDAQAEQKENPEGPEALTEEEMEQLKGSIEENLRKK